MKLKLPKNQQDLVASNAFSLAQAGFHPECTPYGIYKEKTMVGFLMHCIDEDDNNHWVWRLMIDQNHQGKGYAFEAMKLLINLIKEDETRDRILISFVPGNKAAENLYKKLGFVHTGRYVDDERIMQLKY
jgi:diamine N-acetyltransferase